MATKKVDELQQQIRLLESQLIFTNSSVALLLSEANMCDMKVMELTSHGWKIKEQLRDLKAELKDTI